MGRPVVSDPLLVRFWKLVPPLSAKNYKGSSGKVGVVGGSRQYTGAPFFSAISSMRVGGDLATVFCAPDAAVPIKCYSPDIIVEPDLVGSGHPDSSDAMTRLRNNLSRIDALVIGPEVRLGLGRDKDVFETVRSIIAEAHVPLVIDGDGLWMLSQDPSMLQRNSNVILTPNAVEFQRLWAATQDTPPRPMSSDAAIFPDASCGDIVEVAIDSNLWVQDTATLASAFNGAVVLRKGYQDVISDGKRAWVCKFIGSPRRVGGQGDVLSGICATAAVWASRSEDICLAEAAVFASVIVRYASRLAFKKNGRSTLTSDMLSYIGEATEEIYTRSEFLCIR
ncbi:hypothetical protein PBRA_002236 [Plasmodiophora brassicae]|uniref:ATP-dependent (S)-NAD(P)H-hydrate dehydratase n=1 Tax=Plasmodiophora brassicae TaxID=37360 RepID=A0A0G4J3W5_PLABS|nr:hypothetical protein PBRA_002236 [Plasmodiophora brassicae]